MFVWLALLTGLLFVCIANCSIGDICYVLGANTVLLEDQLFFMGGNYSIVSANGQNINPVESIYWLNISSQFPVERSIPYSSLNGQAIHSTNLVAYANAMNGNNAGAMWNTNDTIYIFGGVEAPTNSLSAFHMQTHRWTQVQVDGGNFNFGNRTNALFVSIPESGLNFILGGHDPQVIGGMVRFDASNPDQLSWTNETLGNGSSGIEVPDLLGGGFVYVPAGKEGVLVAFGGYNVSAGIEPDWGWPYYSDFSIIYVYDIASHTWFAQEASAITSDAMPDSITNFCTTVTAAPDYSSFQITIYGGWSLQYGRSFETVYVLSIPSFTWIDATSISNKTNREEQVNSTIGRDTMSCQSYNGVLMIDLGGNIRSGAYSLTNGACSEVFEPVRVLDLSTYEWQTSLNVNATYSVPPLVYNVIGGNANGSATSTVPQAGFADNMLASIMKERVPTTIVTTISSGVTTLSTKPSGSSTSGISFSSNIGAVAGGVVGGVCGLALMIGAIWFTLYRRRKSKIEGSLRQYEYAGDSKIAVEDVQPSALSELHGQGRVLEAESQPVYEMADTREPLELSGQARPDENK